MAIDHDIHFDFKALVGLRITELFHELAETHSLLANLHIDIAFLRGEEARGVSHAKPERLDKEALLAAYTEKKWLLVKLIDHKSVSL